MENIEYDFNKICRVCKIESPVMRYIFVEDDSNGDGPRIDEMLMACTTVVLNYGDGLPNLICLNCNNLLKSSYEFKQLCEDTDTTLRGYLKDAQSCSYNIKQEFVSNSTEYEIIEKDIRGSEDEAAEAEDKEDYEEGDPKVKSDLEDRDGLSRSDFVRFLDNNQLLLTCRTCSKCFTTLDGLKCHKRLHTGSLLKCKQCGKKYTRQNHLQRHELSHRPRKVHVCKICNKTLTRMEHLKRHLVTHLKEKPHSCDKCNRGFSRSEHLFNHLKRCKGDRVYICDICNKSFNRQDSLSVHKSLHVNTMPVLPTLDNLNNIGEHYVEIDCSEPNGNEAVNPFSDSDSDPEPDPIEPTESQIESSDYNEPVILSDLKDVANIETETESDIYAELDPEELLEQKAKIETDILENENEQMEVVEERQDSDSGHSEYLPTKPIIKMKRKRGRPRKNFSSKVGRPRGRPSAAKIKNEVDETSEPVGDFVCPTCNKVFPKMSLLEKHADKHTGLKLHSCGICEKKFSRANHLKRHLLCHLEEKLFSCTCCPKRFNRRDHLMQHMKLHVRTREYKCEECKQSFNREDQLAKHLASKHNIGEKIVSEKKYQCSVCLKSFTTEKYRDVHMKSHTGDKDFQCRICEKAFISKSHLTEHIKFHNENSKKFLCSECGQRFIRNDYLVIHMRRHRGEKPFKCQFCGKGFPRTTDLTVHERYHTGEKTHLCTICGRGFGRAYNLTVHMRTHTGEKPYRCTYCDAAFAQGNDLKAHVRRHTGERFHCELCSESFLMGYLLTQHKRNVHGLNVVSNIRRLQPVFINRDQNSEFEDKPPITIPLPPPIVSVTTFNSQMKVSEIKQDSEELDDPTPIPESLVMNAVLNQQIPLQQSIQQLALQ